MYWNWTPLVICLLMICQVTCPPPHLTRGHPPRDPPGNAVDGAFGGDPKPGQVRWRTAVQKAAVTEQATTEKVTTEEPTTAVATTEEPTTEVQTTKELTTEEPTTEEPTTVVTTTEAPLTEEPTTAVATTEEATTEEQTKENPILEKSTTVEFTTEQETTQEVTTEEPRQESTAEELITEEPTTIETVEGSTTADVVIAQEVTTEAPIIEAETTIAGSLSTDTPADPQSVLNMANVRMFDNKLPDGTEIKKLGKEYQVYPGVNDWSRIVANEDGIFVLHPVQRKEGQDAMFDPFTIGQVLGYIYEKKEFGDKKPPSGKYTIELMGKSIPSKRSVYSGKIRRAALIFTKKTNV